MKKGIFLPTFAILSFVLLSSLLYLFVTERGVVHEVQQQLGQLSPQLFTIYAQAELDLLRFDAQIRQAYYTALLQFAASGGIPPTCNGDWRMPGCGFSIDYFLEVFQQETDNLDLLVEVEYSGTFLYGTGRLLSYLYESDETQVSYQRQQAFAVPAKHLQRIEEVARQVVNCETVITDCIAEPVTKTNSTYSVVFDPVVTKGSVQPVVLTFLFP